MKKGKFLKTLLLTGISAMFIGINSVSAYGCEDAPTLSIGADFFGSSGISTNTGGSIFNYKVYDHNGQRYTAYCRQVGRQYAISYTGILPCKYMLFDPKAPESTRIYDAGVIAILKNGYSPLHGGNNDLLLAATTVAVRTYEMILPSSGPFAGISTNKNDHLSDSKTQYYRYYSNKVMEDANLQKKYKEVYGTDYVKFTSYVNSSGSLSGSGVSFSTIINKTRELINLGLDASLNYKKYGAASIKWNDPAIEKEPVQADENGVKSYKAKYTYTFKLKQFSSDGAYVKLNFDCPECTQFNVSYDAYLLDESGNKHAVSDNLVDYTTRGTGNVKLVLEFSADSTNYDCEKFDFKIKLRYKDDSISTAGYNYSQDGGTQDFYILTNVDKEMTDDIDLKGKNGNDDNLAYLCTADCEDLKKQCEEKHNPRGCEEFEKEWNSRCVECAANIGKAECTAEDTEFDIKEGHAKVTEGSCDITDKADIRGCIINRKDKAGNSYNATNLVDSKYCTVACKEDYHLVLPGQKEANSGRYFTLQASIKGTKSCYSSHVDKESFLKDLDSLRKETITAYNEYAEQKAIQDGASTYTAYTFEGGSKQQVVFNSGTVRVTEKENEFSAIVKKYNDTIEEFNKCSNWATNVDYNFDPKIEFDYEETYMTNVFKNNLDAVGDITKTEKVVQSCSGEVDDYYDNCSTGWNTVTGEVGKETINQFVCRYSPQGEVPVRIICGNQSIEINNATTMKMSMDAEGNFITPTQFFTIFSTGGVVAQDPDAENPSDIENSEPITNGLPIGLGTGQGVYSYYLNIKNLGEFYDTGELGRVWGSDKSVVGAALNDPEDTCLDPGQLSYDDQIKDGRYVCSYKVNCPDCPVECEPDDCYNPDCEDNNCPVICDGCIYTNGESNISYRPITPEVLNPNNRDLGVNWQYDDTQINTALELKAYATSQEIEEDGETIYDIDPDTGETATGDVSMKFTMDSKMMKKIQEYNRDHEDDGGYASNTLDCYDYKDSDGKTYKNIYCYSTFIDELLESDLRDNITISGNRLEGNARKNTQTGSDYWTTWDKADSSKWNVTTEYGLNYANFKKNFGAINIGPSWK